LKFDTKPAQKNR